MSNSNPPPPSQNLRNNGPPKPPSLTIHEALARINRERYANLTSTGFPRTTPQPSPSSNPPYRFVNPQDVEQTDVSKFWRAGEETIDEKDGEFLEECRRERQKWKEEAKRAADKKKENENASVERDVQDEVDEQVEEQVEGEVQPEPEPEPASPNPEKKEENEWKYLKKIAGLPPKRSSAYRKESEGSAK